MVGSQPWPQILDYGGSDYSGKHSSFLRYGKNYDHKKFYLQVPVDSLFITFSCTGKKCFKLDFCGIVRLTFKVIVKSS